MTVGDALPDMPLFLTNDLHVMVPLEPTYQATWVASPEELRIAVETGVRTGTRSGVSGQQIFVRGVSFSNSPKRNRLRAGLLHVIPTIVRMHFQSKFPCTQSRCTRE